MSRGQTSRKKMEEMLKNHRNKRIQRKLPKAQTSTNSEQEKFQKNLLEKMETQDNFFRESMQKFTHFKANYYTSIFNDGAKNE